jgi:hypothetical protein
LPFQKLRKDDLMNLYNPIPDNKVYRINPVSFFSIIRNRILNQEKISMARNFHFRKRSSLYFFPLLFVLAIFACTKPQIAFQNIGNSNNDPNVITVDTFAVQMSTVFLDSFTTSGTKAQLLGRYIDPYFGTITTQSYSDIGTPSPLPSITNYSVYDSIQLIMRIDRSFYGDTTKVQRFNVSQLTQVMNFPGTQNAFYNNQSIPYDPTILGSTDVRINPTAGLTTQRIGDTIKIKMPYSLGAQLFDLLYRQPDTITNPAIFRGYFKGLTVYPDVNLPGAVYGFKDSMVLRLFYHEPGVVVTQEKTDFGVVNQFSQFNHITADRLGTPTEKITRLTPELQSTASGNQAFFQPITSLYVKLLFPTIGNLATYPDYLAVMKATLEIKPVQGTYSPQYNLPPLVNLSFTGEGNNIGATLPAGTGSLNIDYLYGTNTNYSYDITTYIQGALAQGAPNNAKNGLLMVTPAALFNITFNRAVIGNAYNAQLSNQISLKVYYASYYQK